MYSTPISTRQILQGTEYFKNKVKVSTYSPSEKRHKFQIYDLNDTFNM